MPIYWVWLVFSLAFFLRVGLSFLPGLAWDMGTFTAWSMALVSRGIPHFYGSLWCDYPPGYLYILWMIGHLYRLIHPVLDSNLLYPLLIKFPPILADLGIGFVIYRWTGRYLDSKYSLIATALFLFNPAIWLNSAIWGQADSVLVLWLLAAIYFLIHGEGKALWAGGGLLGLAILTKPQALLFLPLIGLWLWRRHSPRKSLFIVLATLGAMAILSLPFSVNQPWGWLISQYQVAAKQYQSLSLNAFNFWALFGFWRPDSERFLGFKFFHWGLLLFGMNYLWILWRVRKTFLSEAFSLGAFLVAVSSFLFLTRMHERYAYMAIPFLLVSALETRKVSRLSLYGILSATFTLNLLYVLYFYAPQISKQPVMPWARFLFDGYWTASFLSILNLATWGLGVMEFGRQTTVQPGERDSGAVPEFFNLRRLRSGSDIWIACLFFAAALSLCLFHIEIPQREYYDEVHHVKTARQFIRGEEPTEWTHPHLGKMAMALSMAALGDNSYAWRLPEAVMGSGIIALVYLLGAWTFKSRMVGLLAALLLLFDGLQFAMSRIGMLDVYVTFFILSAYIIFSRYFYMEWKTSNLSFLGLGISLGLALSSKWTGLYAYGCIIGLLAVTILQQRRLKGPFSFDLRLDITFLRCIAFLILAPIAVYLLSYFLYVQMGHSLGEVLNYQRGMWNYHAKITQAHRYASAWWSWPLLMRPVWLYFSPVDSQNIQGIVFLGNPAVFWLGIPCMAYTAWAAVNLKSRPCFLIFAAFCFQYLPWGIAPRKLLFFHHFYSALPFLCISIAYCLNRLWLNPKLRSAVLVYMAVVLGLFVYFYPILSAQPISRPSFQERMWFKNWI